MNKYMSTLKLKYRDLPDNMFNHIPQEVKGEVLNIDIKRDNTLYFNVTGGPADVLLYLDSHLNDIIIDAL